MFEVKTKCWVCGDPLHVEEEILYSVTCPYCERVCCSQCLDDEGDCPCPEEEDENADES